MVQRRKARMDGADDRPYYDVGVQFQLPEGAGETLSSLILGLRASGPGWSWWVDSERTRLALSPAVAGVYQFDDEPKERRKPFLLASWYKRGDGLGGVVTIQCEDEVMWEAGVFHQLLSQIVAIWPETKVDIDRALRDEPAKDEQPWKKYNIHRKRWERWGRIRDYTLKGLTQEQMAEKEDRDISRIKNDFRRMKEEGLLSP